MKATKRLGTSRSGMSLVEEVDMAHAHGHDEGHVHGGEPRTGGDLTGFAFVKYGFILVMTIVILWFIANYFLGG